MHYQPGPRTSTPVARGQPPEKFQRSQQQHSQQSSFWPTCLPSPRSQCGRIQLTGKARCQAGRAGRVRSSSSQQQFLARRPHAGRHAAGLERRSTWPAGLHGKTQRRSASDRESSKGVSARPKGRQCREAGLVRSLGLVF
jgi:hypothetical protein